MQPEEKRDFGPQANEKLKGQQLNHRDTKWKGNRSSGGVDQGNLRPTDTRLGSVEKDRRRGIASEKQDAKIFSAVEFTISTGPIDRGRTDGLGNNFLLECG